MSPETHPRDKILVVDDTPDSLGFLTQALEQAGHTALVATSGEAAIDLLLHITPDLVLMDAVMPGMDGFETCRKLKQEKHSAHLPVIFMTALNETEHVVKGLQAGGVDYLAKPIKVDELLARIRVHLANARIAYGARTALDATGRSLIAVSDTGQRLWSTPQAEHLLISLFSPDAIAGPALPDTVTAEIIDALGSGEAPKSFAVSLGEKRLEFSYMSRTGPNEFLFYLTEASPGAKESILREAHGLTGREAEVLVWISAGKSNRDISDILGISPRTVNKHLEQIFVKLGVENRAAAAAITVRALSLRV